MDTSKRPQKERGRTCEPTPPRVWRPYHARQSKDLKTATTTAQDHRDWHGQVRLTATTLRSSNPG